MIHEGKYEMNEAETLNERAVRRQVVDMILIHCPGAGPEYEALREMTDQMAAWAMEGGNALPSEDLEVRLVDLEDRLEALRRSGDRESTNTFDSWFTRAKRLYGAVAGT